MKKIYFLSALTAAMLASCSSIDDAGPSGSVSQKGDPVATGDIPVVFNAYTSRGVSRSGVPGEVTTSGLKSISGNLGKAGFGVFGYYTDSEDYAGASQPNFMYNQQVAWNGQSFDYTPLRYWPNEHGSNAASEDVDRISFFAYAPFVDAQPETGWVDDPDNEDAARYGITGFSRNTATGDPIVKYVSSFEASKTVDLCWGVYDPTNAGNWKTFNSDAQVISGDGLPWLNVQRAKTVDQRLTFTFKHALAQLNILVDAYVDGNSADYALGQYQNHAADGKTKIYVRSIAMTGIASRGALNLNNVKASTPLWMNYQGTDWMESGQKVTVYDGRHDGSEGTVGAADANEYPLGLNSAIISNDNNTTVGVTNEPRNLFGSGSVYVIPTGEAMKMTITYDVETQVDDLVTLLSDGKTPGSRVQNCITKDILVPAGALKLEGGKKYTIGLHLGLNSVKFDAAVDEWPEDAEEAKGDLPLQPAFSLMMGGSRVPSSINMLQTDDDIIIDSQTNPEDMELVFTSSDVDVVTIASADAAPTRSRTRGEASEPVTAKSIRIHPVGQGTATITATSESGSVSFIVNVGAISLTNTSTTAPISLSQPLALAMGDGDAAITANAPGGETPSWTSENTDVATVIAVPEPAPTRGLTRTQGTPVEAKTVKIHPVGVGTTTITISTSQGSISLEVTVTTANPEWNGVLATRSANWDKDDTNIEIEEKL